MASSKFRNLLWDCGGVLLTNGWDHTERAKVLAQFSLDYDAFDQRHEAPNDAWEKGELSVAQYLELTLFYEKRSFTLQQFVDAMKAQSVAQYPENLQLAATLAATGKYQMCLLNNEARELNDYRIRTFNLRQSFTSFFSSCYMGLRKPGRAIYQRALDLGQFDPAETIFIDDRKENLAAAAQFGIHAVHMQSPAQLRAELQSLGISAA